MSGNETTRLHVTPPPLLPPHPFLVKSQVKPLVGTEPGVVSLQGMVVVSEPLLGCALVGLTSDGECITMTLPVR